MDPSTTMAIFHPMPHMDRRNNELFNARIRHASMFFFEFLKHEQIRHKIGKDIKKTQIVGRVDRLLNGGIFWARVHIRSDTPKPRKKTEENDLRGTSFFSCTLINCSIVCGPHYLQNDSRLLLRLFWIWKDGNTQLVCFFQFYCLYFSPFFIEKVSQPFRQRLRTVVS